MRGVALLAATLAVMAGPAGAEETPVRVHVKAGPPDALGAADRKAREKETDIARKRAEQERKTLAKTLASAHGKSRDSWPAEARERLDAAVRNELMAILAHHAIRTEAKDLADSARDISSWLEDEVEKTPRLALTESADAADVVAEVLARRGKSGFPAAAFILYLKVTPAAGGASERFAGTSFGEVRTKDAYLGQIMGVQKLAGAVTTAHAYSEAEPYWIIEVFQQGTGYHAPARTAAEAIAAFALGLAGGQEDASAR